MNRNRSCNFHTIGNHSANKEHPMTKIKDKFRLQAVLQILSTFEDP